MLSVPLIDSCFYLHAVGTFKRPLPHSSIANCIWRRRSSQRDNRKSARQKVSGHATHRLATSNHTKNGLFGLKPPKSLQTSVLKPISEQFGHVQIRSGRVQVQSGHVQVWPSHVQLWSGQVQIRSGQVQEQPEPVPERANHVPAREKPLPVQPGGVVLGPIDLSAGRKSINIPQFSHQIFHDPVLAPDL